MSFPETVVLNYGETKAETTDQRAPLGTRGVLPDGRVFRYAKAGGAITVGALVTGAAPAGNYIATSGGVTPAATTFTSTWKYITIVTSHQSDSTAETANTYAEGYMVDPKNGQVVRIATHDGHTASSTEQSNFYFEEGDRLSISITGTDQAMMVMKNPYDDCIIAPAAGGAGAIALGYSTHNVDSGSYFWLQTWGPVGAVAYGTWVAGNPGVHSTETATAIGPITTTDQRLSARVGQLNLVAAAAKFGMINVQLSP